DDLASGRRYNAACAAAQASAGRGVDAGQLTDAERADFRRQALSWLNADLMGWSLALKISPSSAEAALKTLRHWQSDPDLAEVRETAALEGLSADEGKSWQRLWSQVSTLVSRQSSE